MAVGGDTVDPSLASPYHSGINMINSDLLASHHHAIYIWMSVGTQQFGHSSLLLSNGDYISWWPKGRKMKCGPMSKVGNCSMGLQEDIEKETFEPDYTFCIPNESLDVNKMAQYWYRWKERGYYKLLNRNCCSMVYKVLHKGGAPRSATLVWRPETLRRYLIIYLGGGSKNELFWNLPGWDKEYKESHTVYIWREYGTGHGHASLCLEGRFYISWWPFIQTELDEDATADWVDIQQGNPSFSREEDIQRIGRADDTKITFRPKNLDLSEMKRRWAPFIGEEQKELWAANSFWLIYEILIAGGAPGWIYDYNYRVLIAGGAPDCSQAYECWNGDTLEKYMTSNYTTVQN